MEKEENLAELWRVNNEKKKKGKDIFDEKFSAASSLVW